MSAMSTPLAHQRYVLVPSPTRHADPTAAKVRRYRLARKRLTARREAMPSRFPQLTRTYD